MQETAQQLPRRSRNSPRRSRTCACATDHPPGGVVARINVQPGQTVEPNTVVAEVVDPSRLVVNLNVPAAESAI